MEPQPDHELIARLVAAAAHPGVRARLLAAYHGRSDRDVPIARDWLRRWLPLRAPLTPLVCSCAAGRCAVCN
jgi:hypothetical protein